jgi:hypothetical protein
LVLSKNFLPARWAKLAPAHGELVRSSPTCTAPALVVMVIGRVPSTGMSLVGGVPTSLRFSPCAAVQTHRSSLAAGFGSDSKPPNSQIEPSAISSTASPAATPAWIWRDLRVEAALRAICRSYLARASLRCRSLLEATRAPLPLCMITRADSPPDSPSPRGARHRDSPERVYG